jgi:hypothetical protein
VGLKDKLILIPDSESAQNFHLDHITTIRCNTIKYIYHISKTLNGLKKKNFVYIKFFLNFVTLRLHFNHTTQYNPQYNLVFIT